MYKKGFTLQELLISMAIIGLIAAAIAPAINSIMPDKRKAMYMKAYNTLTNTTNEILSDPSLYFTKYYSTGELLCSGLGCPDLPVDYAPCNEADWKCQGTIFKFPKIFATKVNYVERTSPVPGSIISTNIKTIDGIDWTFKATKFSTTNTEFDVIVDVNYKNTNTKNKCTYNSSTCPNPDKFEFKIDNDGGITVIDPLGRAFLENPTEMNSIREDKVRAKKIEAGK